MKEKGGFILIRKTLYPKTKRLGAEKAVVTITEKIDGSNLSFFKLEDKLYVAQRNNIYSLEEGLSDDHFMKNIRYKHLYEWLKLHGETLQEDLQENAVISGEWIAMGKIDYGDVSQRFLQFAKGNLDDDLNLVKLNYNHEYFKWSFKSQSVPAFIGVVPVVSITDKVPTKEQLDLLYEEVAQEQNHPVEGFVVAIGNSNVQKYVRLKNGKLQDHFVWGGK